MSGRRRDGAQPGVAVLLGGFGFFDEGFLAHDDDDARIGDVKAAAVGFDVVTDLGALGQADVAVDNGAPNARVAADVHMIVDCLLYTSPSPRDLSTSRMPSSA